MEEECVCVSEYYITVAREITIVVHEDRVEGLNDLIRRRGSSCVVTAYRWVVEYSSLSLRALVMVDLRGSHECSMYSKSSTRHPR